MKELIVKSTVMKTRKGLPSCDDNESLFRCACWLLFMGPVQPKTEKALAAAFISTCAARNFRLQALTALEKLNLPIDSYGACHRNHNGKFDKVETLKGYKFSLAFENSNEEDYVTDKFFQSLVSGAVPVVVGAPNIEEFASAPGSILHRKGLEDVEKVAKTLQKILRPTTIH